MPDSDSARSRRLGSGSQETNLVGPTRPAPTAAAAVPPASCPSLPPVPTARGPFRISASGARSRTSRSGSTRPPRPSSATARRWSAGPPIANPSDGVLGTKFNAASAATTGVNALALGAAVIAGALVEVPLAVALPLLYTQACNIAGTAGAGLFVGGAIAEALAKQIKRDDHVQYHVSPHVKSLHILLGYQLPGVP
ncbi:hypothetical protein B0T24DRAFT_593632 [Lasiosphaeria ovina]|uniref:Uncharacterized protein n=1 Tax=Lasiosphaeria ovina TaxID=92902 RepID=A0AAE0KAW5_9PEZI|nr:hypothetical protein B0T24DRAFT_593632 [Lasiosphaeria ovina]